MISICTSLSTRLAPFIRMVTVDLPEAYSLGLHGSWANGEYHVLKKNGLICSYSDVDFTCGSPLQPNERVAIETMLHRAATSCGLELQGISIRHAEEMGNMWALPRHGYNGEKNKEIQSEFIQFWTYIGAAEICAAWLLGDNRPSHKHHYYLNKWFLSIWRDLSIVRGRHLSSYLETLHFALPRLSAEVCGASYALKLGRATTVPWNILQSAHQSAILNELSPLIQGTGRFKWIRDVIYDLPMRNGDNIGLWAKDMIEYAKDFEGNLPTRQAARARLYEKLKRRVR